MEGDKKRKRIDQRHHHHLHPHAPPANGAGEPKKGEDDKIVAEKALPQPSEEEVEEFFTILRRMNMALKYFEKGAGDINANGDGRKRTALALEAVEVDGDKIGEESKTAAVVVENVRTGLDLNVVPEAET